MFDSQSLTVDPCLFQLIPPYPTIPVEKPQDSKAIKWKIMKNMKAIHLQYWFCTSSRNMSKQSSKASILERLSASKMAHPQRGEIETESRTQRVTSSHQFQFHFNHRNRSESVLACSCHIALNLLLPAPLSFPRQCNFWMLWANDLCETWVSAACSCVPVPFAT